MIRDVVEKLLAKYGDDDVKKYYAKFDAAVEVRLTRRSSGIETEAIIRR